jgi:hypothetical protein
MAQIVESELGLQLRGFDRGLPGGSEGAPSGSVEDQPLRTDR